MNRNLSIPSSSKIGRHQLNGNGHVDMVRVEALNSLEKPTFEHLITRFEDDFDIFQYSMPHFQELQTFLFNKPG